MKRHWLLFSLALTAGALTLSAIALGTTWATTPAPPPSAAGTEEPQSVPPIVRQTFEEDCKAIEKARVKAVVLSPKDAEDRSVATDTLADRMPALPGKYRLRVPPYVFLSDVEINPKQPMFRDLADLCDRIAKEFRLATAERVVSVYVFESRDRYEKYMQARYPTLPNRRALFIAQPRPMGGEDLLVFTFWSDRTEQDLRQELTYALLYSTLRSSVKSSPSPGSASEAAVPAVASALPKQGIVPELVAILNETKSIDTYIVTLRLLEGMGPQAEPAIPAIIRNTERLELFKDHFTRKDGNGELLDDILESLEKIRGQNEKSHGKDPLLARPKDPHPVLPPDPPMNAEKN